MKQIETLFVKKIISIFAFSVLAFLMSATTLQAKTVQVKNSAVTWLGAKKVGDKHGGTIDLKSGSFILKGDKIVGGKFVIDMNTIKNDDIKNKKSNRRLVGHLKNADFFDVSKYPNASFTIDKVIKKQSDGNTHVFKGKLIIKDVTQPFSFPVQVVKDGNSYKIKGTFVFNRAKFNVKYNSESFFKNLGDKIIKNEIEITFDVST